MKKKEERLEKQMADVKNENKQLVEPLQKAREEVAELQRQLSSYEKDKQLLAASTCLCEFDCIKTTSDRSKLLLSRMDSNAGSSLFNLSNY